MEKKAPSRSETTHTISNLRATKDPSLGRWVARNRLSPSSLTVGDGFGVTRAQGGSPLALEAGRLACGAPYAPYSAVGDGGRGAVHLGHSWIFVGICKMSIGTVGLKHGILDGS